MASGTKWTVDEKGAIADLWSKGNSAGMIAQRFGATRNAIIGVVHRLGLSRAGGAGQTVSARNARKSKADETKRLRNRARAEPEAARPTRRARPAEFSTKGATPDQIARARQEWDELQEVLRARRDVGRVHSIVDLEAHHCRWPVGDKPYAYCGDTKVPGSSYCACHLARSRVSRDTAWLPKHGPSGMAATDPNKSVDEMHELAVA